MLDAVVQFIRNLLCCVKDLELFSDTFMYDPSVTGTFLDLPSPLNKTTPLEVVISTTQFYACASLAKSGLSLLLRSVSKSSRIQSLLDSVSGKKDSSSKASKSADSNKDVAGRLVVARLVKDGKQAIRGIVVGTLVMFLGICFFWLFANSWHVTEAGWIGGLAALIHALTVMEVALVVLLYFMLVDAAKILETAKAMENLANSLVFKGKMTTPPISLTTYELMSGWDPSWEAGFEAEIESVCTSLAQYRSGDDDGEKEEKIRNQLLKEVASRLESDTVVVRMEGYREYLYFALNFIAFYGYMLSVLCYYFDKDDFDPTHVRTLKLGFQTADADWHGNFAGDLMWTVEPIVILGSPMLFKSMKPAAKKMKAE